MTKDECRTFSAKPRWIPPSSLRRDALWKENGNDVIFRKVQGILNKLTPENFEKLSDDILAIGLSSREILKGVILLIFKKSVDEPKYSSMYAQLCKRLAEEAPNFEPPDQPNTFRTLLLNNCRTQFEKRAEICDGLDFLGPAGGAPDEEDRASAAKRKMLGNIKFIGELGKLEILSEAILHKCIQTLLYDIHKHKARDVSEDVECLAQIMKTCGRILDSRKGKVLMTQYFDRMKVLAEMTDFPLRIRFMLKDVIELRRDGWVPRKAITSEGPMPINQIRGDEGLRGGFGVGMTRPTPNAGLDGLFRNPLKTRAGLDDMLGVSNLSTPSQFLPPPPAPQDSYNKGYGGGNNGFSGSNSFRSNRGNAGVYFGGRHNNSYNNNNNKQNNQQHFSSGKDLPPRFKKTLLPPGGGTLIEDISLRPAAFKTPQPKASSLPLGGVRTGGMMNEALLPSPQIQMAKETAILIKQASADKGKGGKKDKGLSKEEVATRVNTLLKDKLVEDGVEECALQIKEIKFPERLQTHVLRLMLNYNLNNNGEDERKKIVELVCELKKMSALSGDKILEAVRDVVNTMAEKEPAIVTGYVKECILQELVSLAAVSEMTEGADHPLMLMVLQALLEVEGSQKLLQRFNESKVNLMNHVGEGEKTKERLAEILTERELTFLYPLSSIQSSLWKQFSLDPNPTGFYKWVKENMDPDHYTNPDFISALSNVIIKYIAQESSAELMEVGTGADKLVQDKEKGLLEKYKPVLQAFLHDRSDLQMVAIYSLQVLCHSLQFPKGMLLRWFMNLYDVEIVEEEAFMKWKEDLSDVYPGKGEALFQVNQWLIWLAEAEEEDDELDESDE